MMWLLGVVAPCTFLALFVVGPALIARPGTARKAGPLSLGPVCTTPTRPANRHVHLLARGSTVFDWARSDDWKVA